MATLIDAPATSRSGNERFFLGAAIAMTLVIVAGFSNQLAHGRSTFYSPPLVHAHAIIFMGWVAIYLTQNILVASDRMEIHRRLGWLAAGWIIPMIVLGFGVTLAMVRRGQVPFFFQPLHFLVFDPLSVLTFAGLTGSAIVLRRQTQWHRRLHLCGMAMYGSRVRTSAADAAPSALGVGGIIRRWLALPDRRGSGRPPAQWTSSSSMVARHRRNDLRIRAH